MVTLGMLHEQLGRLIAEKGPGVPVMRWRPGAEDYVSAAMPTVERLVRNPDGEVLDEGHCFTITGAERIEALVL